MKVLVPLDENKGWDSPVSDELGHAPYFAVVEDGNVKILPNSEVMKEQHPRWVNLVRLAPDVLITREIGRPALLALKSRGVRVYLAEGFTLREVLERLEKGELREFPPELAHEPHH